MNAHPGTVPLPPVPLPPGPRPEPVPRHDAVRLTGGGLLAHIDLNGQIYSLRITRAGKLILTK
jgi:hemin uptake protein HemP